jgi:hypothetical protein
MQTTDQWLKGLALLCCLGTAVAFCSSAGAGEREPPPLILLVRSAVPESGGTVDITLTNLADSDRQARVLLFYEGRPDVQYGRDVSVPAHASLSTWVTVGPAPESLPPGDHRVQLLLYDRTGGQERLLIRPDEMRIRTLPRPAQRREAATAVLADEGDAEEMLTLARTFRLASGLSEQVRVLPSARPLLPTVDTFDGIDHVLVATNQLTHDCVGLETLRRWLQQGGRVWVMLDRVEPAIVSGLLGDGFDFQVVDRVGLTSFTIAPQPLGPAGEAAQKQEHEQPVDFVRVLLPPQERPQHTVNGWPAWFSRDVGRGKVVFTTLAAAAWSHRRTPGDPLVPYADFADLPVPMQALEAMAEELRPAQGDELLRSDVFRRALASDIGYSVVGRGTVGLVFVAFLFAALGVGMALRHWGRAELIGWLGPAVAVGAAGAFLVVGETSRRATPATVAVTQLIYAAPGGREAAVHGLLGVYRPDSGVAEMSATQGGCFEPDATGLEGQIRRRVLTDLDSWHWENLALPAGVRFAPFRFTCTQGEPVRAVARFGADGLEGTLTPGPFQGLSDLLVTAPGDRTLAVRLHPDGSFRAGSTDVLPPGQFLAGALLNDRQQRRRDMYREFLKRPELGSREGQNLLLGWTDPLDMPFTLAGDARTVGTALLAIPLQLVRPEPGARVTVPGPMLSCRRIFESGPTRLTRQSDQRADMDLRFQLPPAVLPLKVERARLVCSINAPGRRIAVAGRDGDRLVELHRVESPLDPIRVEITEERLLRLDEMGGLHLALDVSAPLGGGRRGALPGSEKWTIEYLELEVVGRVE